MTALDDRVRAAIRAKADQVPPDAVPPLCLPERARRRFCSLAYGGGGRAGAPARFGRLAPAAAALAAVAIIAGAVTIAPVTGPRLAPGGPGYGLTALGASNHAATWVAAQVSRSVTVSCDPVMCRALRARGIHARRLLELRPVTADPGGSAVIVATAAVRRELGARLGLYAPAIIASFGSGTARVEIRVIAPAWAAAYRSALAADLARRRASGRQLLHSKRITATVTARRQLLSGQVDTRLLIVIAALAALRPVSVEAAGDSGPGATAGIPLRSVVLAEAGRGSGRDRPGYLRPLLNFLNQQQPPYRPALAGIVRLPDGQPELQIEFAAPSPLGLLAP